MLVITRGLYGKRKALHLDFYERLNRWYFLEMGSWTVELDLNFGKAAGPLKAAKKDPIYWPTRPYFWVVMFLEYLLNLTNHMPNALIYLMMFFWVVHSLLINSSLRRLRSTKE